MRSKTVLFLDSGVGGLPYAVDFRSLCPNESIIYIADTANFPYGSKTREDLGSLLCSLCTHLIKQFAPSVIVLACNTASVSALDILRANFPQQIFVGTVPAVKTAASQTRKKSIGLIATEHTVQDTYIQNLKQRFASDAKMECRAAPDLVEFVEHSYSGSTSEDRLKIVSPYVEYFRSVGVDTLVLACTHFLYLKEEFRILAEPDIQVIDSIDGVARRVATLVHEQDLAACPELGSTGPVEALTGSYFLYTSSNDENVEYWTDFAQSAGFKFVGALEDTQCVR